MRLRRTKRFLRAGGLRPTWLLLVCLASCAPPLELAGETALERAIVGGAPATTAEFESVAFLYFTQRGGTCTGTLIDDDVVLTAAHCLDPAVYFPPFADEQALLDDLHVLFGADNIFDRPPDAVDVRALGGVIHPEWALDDVGTNDIAVVVLDEPVSARPALLSSDAAAVALGQLATLVGYGVDENGDQSILRVVRDKPIAACPSDGVDTFCFDQTDGRGICAGDSGGPAFITVDGTTKIGGVTSFGDVSCAQVGSHTRVDLSVEFLNDALCVQDLDGCTALCGTPPFSPDPACGAGEGEGEGEEGEGEGEGEEGEGEGEGDAPGAGCASTSTSSTPAPSMLTLFAASVALVSVRACVRARRETAANQR